MARKPFAENLYQDPFQSPRANPKRASQQVNGETRKSQKDIIMDVLKKKG
ncbi:MULTISPECIES: YpzG family protein [Bacillaceae]|uniref:YpzG-like protein n=2 Tax=Sediminibacillus TaxID=482460 RepID=A0A1G9VIH3_9BACI|nr:MULTISPECIES: YpzG family protein [Bacillaceae]QTM98380.1 YpzG family protein [Sediminibacillus dalangtanensis]SDM72098.1 YpzG-like protein [Sediminibacillus halophilus]